MALISDSIGPLPYRLLDFDQHSVEAEDCFTRHLPKDKLDIAVRPIMSPTGRKILLANDRIVTAMDHDLNTAMVPGSLAEMLKARSTGDAEEHEKFFEPIQQEYLDSAARLAQLDEQQIERTIMYPGGWGLFAWAYLSGDPLYDNLESFNRYVEEDWGFNTKDRIYSPALLSLDNLDRAVAELDRVLAAGARFVMLPPGPVNGRSPGDPYFDPFWARLNESSAVLALHITEYYYQEKVASPWGWDLVPPFKFSAWQWQNTYGERPITDMLSALIFDNVFGRFPNVRVLVSEFGSEWVPHFIKHMDKSRGMARNGRWLGGQLAERPSTIFKEHVRVVPYPEDDTVAIASQLAGVDCLVMGSDWPHAEGLREPAEFYGKVAGLGDEDRQKFLRGNGLELLGVK